MAYKSYKSGRGIPQAGWLKALVNRSSECRQHMHTRLILQWAWSRRRARTPPAMVMCQFAVDFVRVVVACHERIHHTPEMQINFGIASTSSLFRPDRRVITPHGHSHDASQTILTNQANVNGPQLLVEPGTSRE